MTVACDDGRGDFLRAKCNNSISIADDTQTRIQRTHTTITNGQIQIDAFLIVRLKSSARSFTVNNNRWRTDDEYELALSHKQPTESQWPIEIPSHACVGLASKSKLDGKNFLSSGHTGVRTNNINHHLYISLSILKIICMLV